MKLQLTCEELGTQLQLSEMTLTGLHSVSCKLTPPNWFQFWLLLSRHQYLQDIEKKKNNCSLIEQLNQYFYHALYQLNFTSLENLKDLQWQTAGSVKIDSENYNIFQNIFNATTSLLIQESGF